MHPAISVIIIIVSWIIIFFNWFYTPDEYTTDDGTRFKAVYDIKGNKNYIVEDKDGNISIAKKIEKE